nr:protein decapping 5-like [Ipomoea batatas]
MPMYWQGFYGTPNGLPQLPQQSLLRPPPGLSMPPSMPQMQYSPFNSSMPTGGLSLPGSNLPEYPPSLIPNTASLTSSSLPASSLPSNIWSPYRGGRSRGYYGGYGGRGYGYGGRGRGRGSSD